MDIEDITNPQNSGQRSIREVYNSYQNNNNTLIQEDINKRGTPNL